ncbi:MatE-like protein [Fragilaria crotonensis]|nr:MatE-like protein [Fragilaria crotonensis]
MTTTRTNDDPEVAAVETDSLIAGRDDKQEDFIDDCWDTIKLGFPIFLAMLSWVGMKTTDSSLLGHVSASALASAALSDLWTMCTGVLIQGRVLGILVGGAIGAGNNKLAGIYLQVSYLVLGCISIVVIVSWLLTEQVWVAFGSDPAIAKDAGYYASALALSIPGVIIFSQLSQFFSAQRIMGPEVFTSSAGLILNLLFGLVFVLGFQSLTLEALVSRLVQLSQQSLSTPKSFSSTLFTFTFSNCINRAGTVGRGKVSPKNAFEPSQDFTSHRLVGRHPTFGGSQ